jgi:peptidoglycan/LPS O-acetylase OafA/YrhL
MEVTRAVLALVCTVLAAVSVTWFVRSVRSREGRRNADTAGRFRGPWRFRAGPAAAVKKRERR